MRIFRVGSRFLMSRNDVADYRIALRESLLCGIDSASATFSQYDRSGICKPSEDHPVILTRGSTVSYLYFERLAVSAQAISKVGPRYAVRK